MGKKDEIQLVEATGRNQQTKVEEARKRKRMKKRQLNKEMQTIEQCRKTAWDNQKDMRIYRNKKKDREMKKNSKRETYIEV